MGDIPSSNPSPGISVMPQITAAAPDYSMSPAVATLSAMARQNLISANDIVSMVSKAQELKLQRAQTAQGVQAAGLAMKTAPGTAALIQARDAADLSNVAPIAASVKAAADASTLVAPSGAIAAISGNKLATAQNAANESLVPTNTDVQRTGAMLTLLQNQAHLPLAQFLSKQMSAAFPSEGQPGAVQPATPGPYSAYAKNVLTSSLNSQILQDPQWQELAKTAGTKQGGVSALYDSEGFLKRYPQALADVSDLPPMLTQGDRTQAFSQLNAVADIASRVPGVADILNNSNPRVGPAFGQGESWTNTYNKWAAKLGSSSAVSKVSDQQKLSMFMADTIQGTIRSLAGSGNRVMQAEVQNEEGKKGLFYLAMPGLDSPVQTWKDYLTNRLQLFKLAAQVQVAPLIPSDAANYQPIFKQLDTALTSLGGANASTSMPSGWSEWANQFQGTTVPSGSAAPTSAPPAPSFNSEADMKAALKAGTLKPGAPFLGPDGQQWSAPAR
jgi:hypothetical protein